MNGRQGSRKSLPNRDMMTASVFRGKATSRIRVSTPLGEAPATAHSAPVSDLRAQGLVLPDTIGRWNLCVRLLQFLRTWSWRLMNSPPDHTAVYRSHGLYSCLLPLLVPGSRWTNSSRSLRPLLVIYAPAPLSDFAFCARDTSIL